MKKRALISLVLCLVLCAAALAAPIGFGIVALAEGTASTVINTTPFTDTKEFGPEALPDSTVENHPTEYSYTYTAERAGMLHVSVVNNTTYVFVTKNGTQVSVPVEVAEGDAIYIEFIAIDATMYTTDTMKVELTDFPWAAVRIPSTWNCLNWKMVTSLT